MFCECRLYCTRNKQNDCSIDRFECCPLTASESYCPERGSKCKMTKCSRSLNLIFYDFMWEGNKYLRHFVSLNDIFENQYSYKILPFIVQLTVAV